MPDAATRLELLDRLAEGVAALTSSSRWRRYLEVQGRFHRYSPHNALLIAAQAPGATRVAGFGTWRSLHRTVRRGERAIWILAPMARRPRPDEEEDRPPARGFRFVAVFDVAQTEGDDLPAVCRRLEGDDPADLFGRLGAVAADLGFAVADHEFADGTNGDCSHAERRIRVERRNAGAQRVKTLAHELAHAVLHAEVPDRARAELEAESVAYVVCRSLGLETGGYSFGYVATWAGGGLPALGAIKASCARIQRAAALVVDGVTGSAEGGPPAFADRRRPRCLVAT